MRKTETTAFAVLISLSSFLCLPVQAQVPPHLKVDPTWAKDLPNNWMLGHAEGLVVDIHGHVWVLDHTNTMDHPTDHSDLGLAQNPPVSECCIAAPQVIEFDANGHVLKAWGGPGFNPDWPEAVHGFWVDKMENVWVSGTHAPDRDVLKFSPDGKKLLLKIGRFTGEPGRPEFSHRPEFAQPNNQDTALLGGACGIVVDDDAHEVYLADGTINKRIVVYDSNTGEFKRGWGAYGIPLSEIDNSKDQVKNGYDPTAPPSKQFRYLESIRISNDGLVYVSDRGDNRIQIFTKAGKFVKEFLIARETQTFPGTAMGFDFSRDPNQKYLLVADGSNNVIRIIDRKDGIVVGSFGHTGGNAGQFNFAQNLALDSHGNVYVSESKYNNRIQKFVPEK
jgi:NHL repeat